MKILLLITSSEEIVRGFQAVLSDEYIVMTADSLEKGADLVRTQQVNMVALDMTLSAGVESWFNKYRGLPDILWIGIIPANITGEDSDRYYSMFHEILAPPLVQGRIKAAIRKAQERQDMEREIKHLRLLSITQPGRHEGEIMQMFSDPLGKAVSLSRTITASFDLDRLLNLFLDAVTDVIGVGRLSLLIFDKDTDTYRIKASRGLPPEIISKIHLSSDSSMALWLSAKGRVLKRDRLEKDTGERNIMFRLLREMEVLQAVVSVPIMHEGRLLSILNLDSKITGEPFSNEELEKIFVLSNYIGKAIQDIYKYHRVCYQKEYIQKILEHMGSGVITVNDQEEIILFNPKAGEILKRKAEDLIGRSLESLPTPVASLIRETIRDKKTYRRHEIVSEEYGLCIEADAYGLYDITGALIGGVALLEDISAKRELSREKKRGESLQVLNELVGRMAHELRNPLVAVRTFTQLMKDRYNDPDFQEFFFTTVTGEVEKLNNLIEKLIAFVHPIEYKFETVDMGEVLDKSLESAIEDLKITDFNIVKNYTQGIFRLRADVAQMIRAFAYMLRNSFDAMVPGGTVTLGVESMKRDSTVKISIKDTGRGIPPEDLDRVFDPFYTTPEKGVGLGLPLSQKIIEDHGGKITLNSIPDQGTTLTVLLPVAAPTGEV